MANFLHTFAVFHKAVGAFLGIKDAQTNVEKKVRKALAARREAAAGADHKRIKTFDTFLLKFPKADSAFQEIRKQFQTFDADHSNSIDLDELKACLQSLHIAVSDQEVEELYKEADMDCSDGVQFKEFILLMALIFLLKPSVHFGSKEVEEAFGVIADAFLFFDEDGDGYLTKDEIMHALSKGHGVENAGGDVIRQRFAEMDYNTDGKSSFKEFLFAYVGWVGTAEEDEEEEEGKGDSKEEEEGKTSE